MKVENKELIDKIVCYVANSKGTSDLIFGFSHDEKCGKIEEET